MNELVITFIIDSIVCAIVAAVLGLIIAIPTIAIYNVFMSTPMMFLNGWWMAFALSFLGTAVIYSNKKYDNA